MQNIMEKLYKRKRETHHQYDKLEKKKQHKESQENSAKLNQSESQNINNIDGVSSQVQSQKDLQQHVTFRKNFQKDNDVNSFQNHQEKVYKYLALNQNSIGGNELQHPTNEKFQLNFLVKKIHHLADLIENNGLGSIQNVFDIKQSFTDIQVEIIKLLDVINQKNPSIYALYNGGRQSSVDQFDLSQKQQDKPSDNDAPRVRSFSTADDKASPFQKISPQQPPVPKKVEVQSFQVEDQQPKSKPLETKSKKKRDGTTKKGHSQTLTVQQILAQPQVKVHKNDDFQTNMMIKESLIDKLKAQIKQQNQQIQELTRNVGLNEQNEQILQKMITDLKSKQNQQSEEILHLHELIKQYEQPKQQNKVTGKHDQQKSKKEESTVIIDDMSNRNRSKENQVKKGNFIRNYAKGNTNQQQQLQQFTAITKDKNLEDQFQKQKDIINNLELANNQLVKKLDFTQKELIDYKQHILDQKRQDQSQFNSNIQKHKNTDDRDILIEQLADIQNQLKECLVEKNQLYVVNEETKRQNHILTQQLKQLESIGDQIQNEVQKNKMNQDMLLSSYDQVFQKF